MDDYLIPRSDKALKLELNLMFIATAIVGILCLWLVRSLLHLTSGVEWYSGLIVFASILVIGMLAMYLRQKKWNETSYRLTDDAIIVKQSDGIMATSQEVYLYESIISASMTQGYFAKKYNYGDVILVIPKLKSTIILKALSDPENQLKQLKSHLRDKVHRQTLVT